MDDSMDGDDVPLLERLITFKPKKPRAGTRARRFATDQRSRDLRRQRMEQPEKKS